LFIFRLARYQNALQITQEIAESINERNAEIRNGKKAISTLHYIQTDLLNFKQLVDDLQKELKDAVFSTDKLVLKLKSFSKFI